MSAEPERIPVFGGYIISSLHFLKGTDKDFGFGASYYRGQFVLLGTLYFFKRAEVLQKCVP